MAKLDRERIEAALLPGMLADLPRLCALFDVHHVERWPEHELLADMLSLAAAVALRDRHFRKAHSRTQALKLACGELGMSYDAVERRLRRARDSYDERAKDRGQNVHHASPDRCHLPTTNLHQRAVNE